MSEFNYTYKDLAERQILVDKAEALGQVMLYDHFDSTWKHGDEPHGTMVFTDEPPIETDPEPVMDYKAEILKLKDEVKKLKERK